jgi:hypothetical protein
MRRPSDTVAATGAYVLLTIVLTWPLARGLDRDLPADLGDPLLNCWVLAWDAQHLWRAASGHPGVLGDYWNANIFYPHPLALAYSEHLTSQALTIVPIYALTGNPILCYNLVFLSTFVLSALGMYLFVREMTASRSAAFAAGVAYGFAPYRFGTLAHVQVLSSMWMPFALAGFHRFFETRRTNPLVGAAAAWIAQNLACGYYLLFFSPALGIYLAWETTTRRLWSDMRTLTRLAAALLVVAIATAPFLIPYAEVRRLGFSPRSLGETSSFSADTYAYLTADVGMWLWGSAIRGWPKPEGSLFPGFTVLLLTAVATARAWWTARRRTAASPGRRWRLLSWLLAACCAVAIAMLFGWTLRLAIGGLSLRITNLSRVFWLTVALALVLPALSQRARATAAAWLRTPVAGLCLLTAFAVAMSFGPQIQARGRLIAEHNLYDAFRTYVPGFDGLRVPARFGMIVELGLAALAGWAIASFGRTRRAWVAAVAALFFIVESWAVPIPMNLTSTSYRQRGLAPLPEAIEQGAALPAVYRFIAQLPPSSAIIELPFGEVAFEARYMFYSTFHWRHLVNGYSGGAPDNYGLWAERLGDLVDQPEPAWQAVLASRATHILVHEASYAENGERVSNWARAHGAQEVAAFGSDRLFAVGPPQR